MCLYLRACMDGALNYSEQCVCVCGGTGANLAYALGHIEPHVCVCADINCALSHTEPCLCVCV